MAWILITMVLLLIGGGLLFGALIMGMVSLHRFYDDPDTSQPVNKSYLLRLLASRDLPGAKRTPPTPRDPGPDQ